MAEIERLKELLLKTDARLSEDGKSFNKRIISKVRLIHNSGKDHQNQH